MTSKIITVSVDAEVEQKFRRTAKAVHGKKKGYLGKALTDAMERWTKEREQMDTVAATLALLDKGMNLGSVKYKHRDELHER
jgi:predicted transcriptional regulator